MANIAHTAFDDHPVQPGAWFYLEEITHRTLNDYTALICMLRRASSATVDLESRCVLQAVTRRLESAAAAYAALSPIRESKTRNLDEDLAQLCVSMTASVLAERSIRLTLVCDPASLSSRRCWQISLIVSELIMNAVKHAFSSNEQGAIVVKVQVVGGYIQCAVIDNGMAQLRAKPGTGTNIIDALAMDLGGVIDRNFSTKGSTVILRVPAV